MRIKLNLIMLAVLVATTATAQTEFLNSKRAIESGEQVQTFGPTHQWIGVSDGHQREMAIRDFESYYRKASVERKDGTAFTNDNDFLEHLEILLVLIKNGQKLQQPEIDKIQEAVSGFYNLDTLTSETIGLTSKEATQYYPRIASDTLLLDSLKSYNKHLLDTIAVIEIAISDKDYRTSKKDLLLGLVGSLQLKLKKNSTWITTLGKNINEFDGLRKGKIAAKKKSEAIYQASASPNFLTNINSNGAFSFVPNINVLASRVMNKQEQGSVNTIFLFTSTALVDSTLSVSNPSYWIRDASTFGITYTHTEGWNISKEKKSDKKGLSVNTQASFLTKALKGVRYVKDEADMVTDTISVDTHGANLNASAGLEYFPASNKWISIYANINAQWAITQVGELKNLGDFSDNLPFVYFDFGTRLPMTVNDQGKGVTEVLVDVNFTYLTKRMKKITPTDDIFIPTIRVGLRQTFGL